MGGRDRIDPDHCLSLQIGNIDTIEDLRWNRHDWSLLKSFSLTRQYLDFMKHLAPRRKVFSGVPEGVFDWPVEDKSGVLPTHAHGAFATKSIFDMFSPKSLGNVGKFTHLTEICLNNTQSLQSWDLRGIELFSALGKSVPRLTILDISGTLGVYGELLIYLVFQDAFQSLHQFMYLHQYRVLDLEERDALQERTGHCRAVLRDVESVPSPHSHDIYCPWCLDEGAYHDNLRSGCSQEFYPITVVDDR